MKKILEVQIPEKQIGRIIDRAIQLQIQQAELTKPELVTSEYIEEIGKEIDVDDQYIQLAIEEYEQEQEKMHQSISKTQISQKSPDNASSPQIAKSDTNSKPELPMSKNHILAFGLMIAIGIILMLALQDTTPKYNVGANSTLVVQGNNSMVVQNTAPKEEQVKSQKKQEEMQEKLLQKQQELFEAQSKFLDEKAKFLEQKEKEITEKKEVTERKEVVDTPQNIQIQINTPTPNINVQLVAQDVSKNIEPKDMSVQINALEGKWELVSYHLYNRDTQDFLEVAVVKDRIEIRENWTFESSMRFRHIMDKQLSFSGKFEIVEASDLPIPLNLLSGTDFIIHGFDIRTSFNSQIAHHYYYAELDTDNLILYDIGRKQQYMQPTQGHQFRRVQD